MTEMKPIPLALPVLGEDEKAAVLKTLESGWITTGPQTKQFEEDFKTYIGTKHAIAVNSCTSGLHASLVALGCKTGDKVITSPVTFAATANTVVHTGAQPLFADVEENTGCLDPQRVERLIETNPGVRGIIPVHLAGHPCDMRAFRKIADRHGLFLLEDAAHALGTEQDGVKAGALGTLGCFSFYPIKNITTAEGGMVTTNDDALAAKIRLLINHGITRDSWGRYGQDNSWYYEVVEAGFKYNMTDIQAALGIQQLRRYPAFLEKRARLAQRYLDRLSDVPGIRPMARREGIQHGWHLMMVRIDPQVLGVDRSEMANRLKEHKIGSSVHFIPLHLQPYYREKWGYKEGDFPVAEGLYRQILSLPLYPGIDESDVDRVVDTMLEIAAK